MDFITTYMKIPISNTYAVYNLDVCFHILKQMTSQHQPFYFSTYNNNKNNNTPLHLFTTSQFQCIHTIHKHFNFPQTKSNDIYACLLSILWLPFALRSLHFPLRFHANTFALICIFNVDSFVLNKFFP